MAKKNKLPDSISKLRRSPKKSFFGKILFSTMLIIVVFSTIKNIDQINMKRAELDRLREVEDALRIKNEELTEKLNSEVDNDYIESVARERGYEKLNAKIFYITSDN